MVAENNSTMIILFRALLNNFHLTCGALSADVHNKDELLVKFINSVYLVHETKIRFLVVIGK